MVMPELLQNVTDGGRGPVPGRQAPSLHVSAVVQGLPSLHAALLFTWVHPLAGLHESLVHTSWSLQSIGAWGQVPAPTHSSIVHTLLSMQGLGPGRQTP